MIAALAMKGQASARVTSSVVAAHSLSPPLDDGSHRHAGGSYGHVRNLWERIRHDVRNHDDQWGPAQFRLIRVRDPRSRAPVRTLRLPRDRPRSGDRRQFLLLCPLRPRSRFPGRRTPRRRRRVPNGLIPRNSIRTLSASSGQGVYAFHGSKYELRNSRILSPPH